MFTLPAEFSKLISEFAPLFSTEKVFNRAGLLMLGAVLTKREANRLFSFTISGLER